MRQKLTVMRLLKNQTMNKIASRNSGTFMAVLAGVCWGVISIFVRRLSALSMDSFQIMAYRAWFSVAMLFVYLFCRNCSLLKIKIKDLWIFIGTGILSLTFFSYCYISNIMRSGAAIAVVMLYSSPIFVLIMSIIFFKEKMTLKKGIALIMTFTGCALVSGLVEAVCSGARIDGTGLLLGLGSGIGYALYSLFAGFALKRGYESLTISFYTFLFSGVSLLFFTGPLKIISGISSQSIIWILGVSFVCTVIPYIFYTLGMSKIEISKAAVIVTVEPLVGALLGILAYGEPVGFFKILGIFLIIISVVLLS